MPYKHQAESFRTFEGVRWSSWGDFSEDTAKGEARTLRRGGIRVRSVKIGGGMVRLFTLPADPSYRSSISPLLSRKDK